MESVLVALRLCASTSALAVTRANYRNVSAHHLRVLVDCVDRCALVRGAVASVVRSGVKRYCTLADGQTLEEEQLSLCVGNALLCSIEMFWIDFGTDKIALCLYTCDTSGAASHVRIENCGAFTR